MHHWNQSDQIRGVYYFSDLGVSNFWQSFSPHLLDRDLSQIKNDGFNAIFLLIPWSGFQVCAEPIEYDQHALQNLDKIFDAAERYSLRVCLRMGFLWEATLSHDRTYKRLEHFSRQEYLQKAWSDYFKTLYQRASCRNNFCMAFLTWEDFYWPCYRRILDMTSPESQIAAMRQIGFEGYLSRRLGDTFTLKSDSLLRDQPVILEEFTNYFDVQIERFALLALLEFPNLGYEYRSDSEHLQKDGKLYYHFHRREFNPVATPMTYYNQFTVKDKHLLPNFQKWLAIQKAEVGRKILIAQFNFIDNTFDLPEYAGVRGALGQRDMTFENARDFLRSIPADLEEHTAGYAFWAYRDIQNDFIYNACFSRGLDGYLSTSDIQIHTDAQGQSSIQLKEGQKVSQKLHHVGASPSHANIHITVVGYCSIDSVLELSLWETACSFPVNKGEFTINYTREPSSNYGPQQNVLSLACAKGELHISRLSLYATELTNLLYKHDLTERPLVEEVRKLNLEMMGFIKN